MMNDQGICILFSILLVPVNFLCAFWLFREALQLTGMTYQEYFKKTSSDGEVLLGSEQRWGYTNRFFKAYSSDPEKSMHFMKIYAAALLPGLAAVLLLCYAEAHAERLSGVLIGDFALLAVNAALALAGVLYRRRHPMDPAAAERLREKRRKERAYNRKHWKKIAVKGVVCAAVLLLILYIFVGGTLRSLRQRPAQTETPRSVMLSELLQERGYETENVSLTYRWVVDDPLQAAGGGEKDGNRFELYRYADEETARRAYGQVVNLIAPEMESAARASHQITLTGGGSMFTVILDGVYYLAMTRNSDVIYACSPDSLQEANAILADIGYLHGKS